MAEAKWYAEDVPWYMVDQRERGPQTDEDAAMSAPIHLGTYDTEYRARTALSSRLVEISMFRLVIDRGEEMAFVYAADAIVAGADGVRIHGRYYRVRKGA